MRMSEDKHLKDKPNSEGERFLLSAPEPQEFGYGEYKYSVKPLNMTQRRVWSKLSQERYSLEAKWWKEQEIDNPYIEAGMVLDSVDEGVLIKDMDEEKQLEYLVCLENIDRGRIHAFGEIDIQKIFDLIVANITVVDRDGYTGNINSEYLQYQCTWEEIVFLSSKIDEVSTLSPAEVLGLK